MMFRRSQRSASVVAAALALALLAASAAQAFTFNDEAPAKSGDAAKFTGPADRTKSRLSGDSGDKSTIRSGNTTLQFGGRESFDQRNNGDRYFSPNNLMGR